MSDPRDTLICALLVDAMRADDELCRLRKVESDLLTLIEGVMDAALKRKPGLPRAWFDAAEKMMGCSQGQTLAGVRGDQAVCARRCVQLMHDGHEQVLAECKRRGLPFSDSIPQIIADTFVRVQQVLQEIAEVPRG